MRSLSCVAIFLFFDLLTKWLAQKYLGAPITIWPNVLELKLSYNPGIAFSIPVPNIVMVVASPLLIAGIVWIFLKQLTTHLTLLTTLITGLLIAGGLGNFINRVTEGAVIDFIDFSFWPSFNLADAYLTIAAFLILTFHGRITRNKSYE